MLTIIQIILYEIWITRNNHKYDKTLISQDIVKTKINTQIRNIYKRTTSIITLMVPETFFKSFSA